MKSTLNKLIMIVLVLSIIILVGCSQDNNVDGEKDSKDYKMEVLNISKEDTSIVDISFEEIGDNINCKITVNENLDIENVALIAEYYAKLIKTSNIDKIVNVQIYKNEKNVGGHSIAK